MASTAIAASGLAVTAAYLSYAALAWARFGGSHRTGKGALLDGVMSEFDVRFRHETKIQAPLDLAFAAINHASVDRSPIVQALFRARELLMRARHVEEPLPQGLLAQLESFGWKIVAEEPGRELVFGAITQPWKPDAAFQGLPRDSFVRFREPGYAKIAFTLRVDPIDETTSMAQTETRVQTTDPSSRSTFRRYWAFLSPGMELVRVVLLAQVKAEAELRQKSRAAEPLL